MSEKIEIAYYKTPVGELILGAYKERLCLCDWRYRSMRDRIDQRIKRLTGTTYRVASLDDNKVLDKTRCQLEQYFAKERKEFQLPITLLGTTFQRDVWEALQTISYGNTASYAQLADRISKPKAVRAVASANGANAISIVIPCHRIIGADGALVGYAGGLPAKKKLLNIERASL